MAAQRTNREVEIKLRISDPAALVRALRGLGAVSRGRVLEQNTLFDTPGCDFRSAGRLLRLRVEIPAHARPPGARRAILTSKAPPLGRLLPRFKERLERERAIAHPARWPRALRALGLGPTFRYEKRRTSFRLRDLHLDLDETPAGTFLELEGAPERIDRLARALGFSPGDYIRATYWDLYAADCRRRGRAPRNMLF